MAQGSVCVCVCVRLDLGWTPFSWVANAPDVSSVTSSDIDSFFPPRGWGMGVALAGPASPAQHSHDHGQHTRDREPGRGDSATSAPGLCLLTS